MIGADGVYSLVAEAVRAPEYDAAPPLTTNYYSYYRGFEADDIEMYIRAYQAVGCFPTHDGLTLIAVLWPSHRFHEIRTDIQGHVMKVLESTPLVAHRLRRATREEKWVGTAGVPNYFRQAFGPGWALVGDAAYNKDPIAAQGISDARTTSSADAAAVCRVARQSGGYEPVLFGDHWFEPPARVMNPENIARLVAQANA